MRDDFQNMWVVLVNNSVYEKDYRSLGCQVIKLHHILYTKGSYGLKFYNRLFGVARRISSKISLYLQLLFEFAFSRQIANLIKMHNIELIHLNDQPMRNFSGFMAARKTKISVMSHIRTMNTFGFSKAFSQYALRSKVHFIAISHAVKKIWSDAGIDEKNISVIYNPVIVPNAYQHADKKYDLIYVGRLTEGKGLVSLINVIYELKNSLPLKLAIIGDGDLKEQLKGDVLKKELSDYIEFLGYQKDPLYYIAKSKLLVLPSKNEGFGRVIVEAMKLGVPVIANAVGGMAELIVHQKTGFLFDSTIKDDLKEKISLLCSNVNLQSQLATEALLYATYSFSSEDYSKNIRIASLLLKSRLLIIINSLDLGGAEKHLLTVLPSLVDRYNISIYTTAHTGALAPQFIKQGIKVFGISQEVTKKQNSVFRMLKLARRFLQVFIHLYSESYDVIHFFLPTSYLLGGTASLFLGKKPLIMSRRSQNDYQEKHPISAVYERKLHPHMTAIVANSKKVLNQLKAEGVVEKQLHLIYNGVVTFDNPLVVSKDYKKKLGLLEPTFILTIIANLFFYKGHADLLHALALVKDKLPSNWQIFCVGKDSGELKNLLQLTESLGLSSHIQWLGQRFDIPELIAITDVGLLISHEEGFSNAVLEFMAAGKPMVVTDVGGNAEAVLDGVCGIVVPSKNPEKIADAILKLAHDKDMRLSYGIAAHKRARENFSLQQCVLGYDELYKSVLKS